MPPELGVHGQKGGVQRTIYPPQENVTAASSPRLAAVLIVLSLSFLLKGVTTRENRREIGQSDVTSKPEETQNIYSSPASSGNNTGTVSYAPIKTGSDISYLCPREENRRSHKLD